MEGKFVAYYRQGDRGYGMDAQRKAVEDYLNGGAWCLVGEFTEVESGKRAAMAQCCCFFSEHACTTRNPRPVSALTSPHYAALQLVHSPLQERSSVVSKLSIPEVSAAGTALR